MLSTHLIRDHNTVGTSYTPASLDGDSDNGVWKYVQGVRDQNVMFVCHDNNRDETFTAEIQGSIDGGVLWHVLGELASGTDFDAGGGAWLEVPAMPLMRAKYSYTSGASPHVFNAWIIE